jgi:hypothetical protein
MQLKSQEYRYEFKPMPHKTWNIFMETFMQLITVNY